MRPRNMVSEALGSLIDFGLVVASEVETASRMVLGKIRGDTDPDGNEEPATAQEMWGCPAVMFRPSDEDANGAMEVIFIRRGNEMVGIAYRELRDAPVSLQPGEVCVRAFGTSAAYLHMKPNGDVLLRGAHIVVDNTTSTIDLGVSASEFVVLGTTFKPVFDGHVHLAPAGGGNTGPPLSTAPPGPATVPLSINVKVM